MAGAYGIKQLASGFADSANMIGRFSEVFSVSADEVQALGSALAENGGGISNAMDQIERLEKFRAGLLKGDASFIASLGISSADANDIINAENAMEAYLLVAEQFKNATPQQRINITDALGFDQSGLLLLSKGTVEVQATLDKYAKIRPLTDDMIESAKEYNNQWVEIKANVSSVTDIIGKDLVDAMNNNLKSVNEWIAANKDLITTSAQAFTDTAIGFVTKSAPVTIADKINDGLSDETSNSIGKHITRTLALLGNESAEQAYLTNEGVTTVPRYFSNEQPEQRTSNQSSEQKQTINVNANFTLDGQVIDRKIATVVDGMAQNAIDDISSSTGG